MDNRKLPALDLVIEEAKKIGIDFFEAAEALTVFYRFPSLEEDDVCPVCKAGDALGEDVAALAHYLDSKFPSSSGSEVLYFLGAVAVYLADLVVIQRDNLNVPTRTRKEAMDASLSDFSFIAGMAVLACSKHADPNKPSRVGGRAKDVKTGNFAKRAAIRDIWASGKYSSRDICAEQECAALGMSFSSARKALRRTPGPA